MSYIYYVVERFRTLMASCRSGTLNTPKVNRFLPNISSKRWGCGCPTKLSFRVNESSGRFRSLLDQISTDYREAIVTAIRSLATNRKPQGKRTKKLTGQLIVSHFTAEYRLRIGSYRILYDVDNQRKKVVILNLPSGMSAHTSNGSGGREPARGRRNDYAVSQFG